MSLLTGLALGVILSAVFPSVPVWVRGAAGRVWGAVMGRPPARAATVSEIAHEAPKATQTATRKIDFGQAVKNVTGFVTGFIGWCVKHPILAVSLALLAAYLLIVGPRLPFDWGKSRGELRLERELAEARADIKEHEARLGTLSRDLAVNSERDRSRRANVIAQAQQEIEDAAAQVDPDALMGAYTRGYLCVFDPRTCPSLSNPAPNGAAPVRGATSDPV